MRHKLNFSKHAKATFGSYCEVHYEPFLMNNIATQTTPAIVLGSTGNLQGTYKFLSLTRGKKVKHWAFTRYLMLNSMIRTVKQLAETTARAGKFNFGNRNVILFEWNDKIDKTPEEILEADDIVPYLSMAAKFPGVELSCDTPIPSIEDDVVPQGQAEDAAANNMNIDPNQRHLVDVPGVGPNIVQANPNKIEFDSDDNEDDDIVHAWDAPQQAPNNPVVLDNKDNDTKSESDNSKDNDSSNDKDDNSSNNESEGLEDGEQGPRRSKRKNCYQGDYALLGTSEQASGRIPESPIQRWANG
jgi:hypothetical protein